MIPLRAAAADPHVHKASSLLISGGCTADGRVPVSDHLPAITSLRGSHRLNWHVGLVSESDIDAIAPLADVVSFDFVGDDATIREVYGLHRSVDDYVESYARLRARLRVVPHITLGLRGGTVSGELEALRILAQLGADALVLLVFIPTRGTRYADRRPPALHEVRHLIREARARFPSVPITLGCMRPGGAYRQELDVLGLAEGVDCIVNPTNQARRYALEAGVETAYSEECCVF